MTVGTMLTCGYLARLLQRQLHALLLGLIVWLAAGPIIVAQDIPQPSADIETPAVPSENSLSGGEPRREEGGEEDLPTADPATVPPVSPVFEKLEGKIERVGPDTFILLDAKGNPQPVLNMEIEQFIKAWKSQQTAARAGDQTADAYTLDECRLIGSLEGNHVSLSAIFSVTLHTSDPIEVPLGMAGTLLRKLPTSPAENSGRYIRYDEAEGGYLATVRGTPGETAQVELELMAPVRRDGTRATMRLLAPRATKGSLVLVSKNAIQSIVASEGVVLAASPLVAGGMRVEVEGVRGEFSLSWVDRPAAAEQVESVLSSSSQVLISIDGRDVRSWARLTVRSFGQSFREFTVRLPPGASYVPGDLPPPFESAEVVSDAISAGEEAGGTANRGSELRVTLAADQSEAVTFDLQTIEPLRGAGNSMALVLSGFEVVGAVPQEGEVAIQVDDNWQLRWEPSDSVRLVHPSEVDFSWAAAQSTPEDLRATLRFARQPWSLPVRLVPREERVVATPSYELTINPGEAVLRMQVDYRIEGGRSLPMMFVPRFALAGWDHLQTTTVNMQGTQEVEQQADTLAFATAYATSRRPVVTMSFRRPLRDDSDRTFEFPLPYPDHDSLVLDSCDLIVTADTSIQLTPDPVASVGLVAVPIEDAEDTTADRPPGQQFHYRGVYPPLVFAAHHAPRPQRVLVESDTQVRLSGELFSVEQVLQIDVRHQPASSLLLVTPSKLSNLELELLADSPAAAGDVGTKLEVPALLTENDTATPLLPERRVPLPHPRLGKFRVRARYQIDPSAASSDTLMLSLVSLAGAESGGHQLRLESTLGQSLVPAPGSRWRVERVENGRARPFVPTFAADQQTNFLPLVSTGRSPTVERLEVTKVWVQHWLNDRVVQTRTAFRCRGDATQARIELPSDAPAGDQFEVRIDGVPTFDWGRIEGALEVNLPGGPPALEQTIELRYRSPTSLGWTQTFAPGRPHLVGEDNTAALYWEVIAPVEYQRVAASDSLVAASSLGWFAGDWRSMSEFSTEDLEQWVGAHEGPLRPTSGEHSFLFHGFPEATLRVTLVRRELLVLATSATVLLFCLALAYLPWLRKFPVLLVGAVAVVSLGLAAPQVAATLAPLGMYGLVCGLLMWVLLVMYGPRPTNGTSSGVSTWRRSDASGSHRPSTLLPLGSGSVSTNAPTVSVELTDSNV